MKKNALAKIGKTALGSRLRLLTSTITEDAGKLYELYEIALAPKWFPVYYVLGEEKECTITEIAQAIRQSQPSVSKIVKEMSEAGLVEEHRSATDRRQNMVALTPAGRALKDKLAEQCADIDKVIEELINEATHNLWAAVEEWELLLEQQSLFQRVQKQKELNAEENLSIVPYQEKYEDAFRSLNEAWISYYFKMEASDYKALENPQAGILEKGGKILVALYEDEPVGVCALIKMDNPRFDFELAKMAVSPSVQGKGIGSKLGQAIVDLARSLGATRIYLESNSRLKPALRLYQKLGFRNIDGYPSPYERCDIQMALDL